MRDNCFENNYSFCASTILWPKPTNIRGRSHKRFTVPSPLSHRLFKTTLGLEWSSKCGDDKFYESGPFLKANRNVRYVGPWGIKQWSGKSVCFSLSFSNYLAFLSGAIPSDVRQVIGSPDSPVLSMPAYETCQSSLLQFSDDLPGFKGFPKTFKHYVKRIEKLKFPTMIDPPSEVNVVEGKFKPGTHPGIVTRRAASSVLEMKPNSIKKEHVIIDCVRSLINSWGKISDGTLKSSGSHYCLGGREKVGLYASGDEIKSRPLWIPESFDVLHQSTFFEHWKSFWRSSDMNSSEIWLGHSDAHLRWYRRFDIHNKHRFVYEFDGSQHDAHVEANLIKASFLIFKSCFNQSPCLDKHIDFIFNGFVNKFYHTKDGHMFQVLRGTPTGNVFTSFVNSMSVWLMWSEALSVLPVLSNAVVNPNGASLCVQGDDIIVGIDSELTTEDLDSIRVFFENNYNYKLKMIEKQSLNWRTVVNQAPSFLRRVLHGSLITTRGWDCFEKLLFGPEYSGLKRRRLDYLTRRLPDLCITDFDGLRDLGKYFAFIEMVNGAEGKCRDILNLTMASVNFRKVTSEDWITIVISLMGWTKFRFKRRIKVWIKLISSYWFKIHTTYSDTIVYKDYWSLTDESVSIEKFIRNNGDLKTVCNIDYATVLYGDMRRVKRNPC